MFSTIHRAELTAYLVGGQQKIEPTRRKMSNRLLGGSSAKTGAGELPGEQFSWPICGGKHQSQFSFLKPLWIRNFLSNGTPNPSNNSSLTAFSNELQYLDPIIKKGSIWRQTSLTGQCLEPRCSGILMCCLEQHINERAVSHRITAPRIAAPRIE